MNPLAYRQAFADSHHSPAIRTIRKALGPDRKIVDFCVPVNIGFPPPDLMELLQNGLLESIKYYPSEPMIIREKFANFLGLPTEQVLAGNGSTELFNYILSLSGRPHRLMTCIPTFGRWTDAPQSAGHQVINYVRRRENGFGIDIDDFVQLARRESVDLVVISNPNNPTGQLTSKAELLQLIERLRSEAPLVEKIVVDESFLDFSARKRTETLLHDVGGMDGVLVLKSLGKMLGLHGTRMGVLVGESRAIQALQRNIPYWNVNGVAEAVIDVLPQFQSELQMSLNVTIGATRQMRESLNQVSAFTVFPTEANYVYTLLDESIDPVALRDFLLIKFGFFLRSCGNKLGSNARFFRIATRPPGEIEDLVRAVNCF